MLASRVARFWVLLCLVIGLSSSIFAQGARVNPSGTEKDSDRDQPAAREKWFMQGRVAPKGKTPAEMRWHAYQQKIRMRAARIVESRQAGTTAAAAVSSGWTALGPAPLVSDPGTGQDYGFVSGRATSVLIDPADSSGNTVYLGGAYGGLWRTTNGANANASAVTWSPMIDTQPTLAVGAIAVQPGNATSGLSNVVLVGTGEANSSADSYYGLGILRSADHGQTWTLITQDSGGKPFQGIAFSKIAFSTANTSLVVAAVASSPQGIFDGARTIDNRGVYVSSNAGQTWTYETSVKDGSSTISPLSNSVTSVVYNAGAAKFYAAFRYHGFYSSTDGANWTRLAAQPAAAGSGLNSSATCPAVASTTNCPIYRGEIAVVPGRNEMYVWYVYNTTTQNDIDVGVWKTTNGGGTWTQVNDNGVTNCGETFGCGTAQGGYDLELAAIPNPISAGATDLYVGARNVYKCTITTATPDCSGTVPNTMMNLTHVYGCVGVGHATVHPDQHGLDFIVAGGQAVMYFAHDGGVNRTLNGFALTNSGSCNTPFDDLNGTLGSMTEFVSFSQDPANSATLLGGTQDNGSPSTSQTTTNWHSVLGGDGGYNEIDPVIPSNWYAANTDVNIYFCNKGSLCLDGNNDFVSAVTNADLGGDAGPFYTRYILDPQNTATRSALLIGTCRIWRGTTAAGFTAISPDFFLGSSTCSSASAPIHALAAGGPKDTVTGFSKVIYAGQEGTGSGPGVTPQGGGVFVTTNSGASWSTQSVPSSLNPSYTIGDIAIDTSDPNGTTAYVGLQGFGTNHVLKTTNAGTSWSNFSTGLPNAPVNSLLVDTVAHVLYVGMDVGVFSTSTTAASWTEVGPAPSSGTAGYIPDAPVTRLRMFNNAGTKILRASTYGRGIWQFQLTTGTPDFTVSVPTTLTAYPNQTLPYNGTLTAVNAYASPVGLTCTGGVPTTCAAATTPVTPTAGGAAFAINAANASVADFSFTIHALGTDSVPVVHDTPVTLHVVDFAIPAPNPGTVTANIPNVSNPTTFTVSASGSFADTVTLGCIGVPPGAICSFSPSATVQPTSSTPVLVTLTVGASTMTTPGSYPLTISAHDATNPEPVAKVQALTLNVTANPDYTLAIGNPTPPAITKQGQQPFNGTLTAFQGYNKPVTITCAAGATAPPATCLVTTSPTTPTVGGASFTVLTADTVVGTLNFIIHTTDGTITHDLPVTLVLQEDFNIINTTTSQTVTAGGTASYTPPLSFNPDGAATFLNAVSYTCTGLPSLSSCTFSPASIPAGSGSTPVTLSIHTTAPVASGAPLGLPWKPSGPLFAFWLSLPALGIVSMGAHRRARKRLAILGGLLALGLVGSFAACGGGSSHQPQPGTPPGPYTVTIKAVSGIANQSTTVKLVVK